MLPFVFLVAAALIVAPAAHAQEAQEQPQAQHADADVPAPPRFAVPRAPIHSDTPADRPEPAQPEARRVSPRFGAPQPAAQAEAPPPAAAGQEADGQRRAVPRGSRPRGDNPPVGTAVPRPRGEPADRDRGGRVRERDRDREWDRPRDRDRTIVVTRPPVYNNYYYYPRRTYPYGYGAFGLGYFYYDPYQWYPRGYSAYGPGYSRGGYYRSRFDTGELRLNVRPRHAQVFVDGYYAGIVDDFDGAFQSLKLEPGPYRIEIVAPGYEPLDVDVRISPGQKIDYRGDLVLLRRP